jgi:hypothetical protein
MIYPVTEWKMSPKELEEYREKHPIKQTKKETVITFSSDYKWRGKKAAAAKKRSRLHDE